MAKTRELPDELRQGEPVVASVDMPGIPEGTRGDVVFATGFTWVRYWVRFSNGVIRGSLNRKRLARPQEWIDIQARRERGEDEPAAGGRSDGELVAVGADAGGGAPADGGDSKLVNGVPVPGHLIERSKSRREFLGK